MQIVTANPMTSISIFLKRILIANTERSHLQTGLSEKEKGKSTKEEKAAADHHQTKQR